MRASLVVPAIVLAISLPEVADSQPDGISLRTRMSLASSGFVDHSWNDTLSEPSGSRSPAFAAILSAGIPGAGQVYANRYWTIPLIWGFGYWFVRNYIQIDRKYVEWRDLYSRSVQQGPFTGTGDPQAKYIRDFYRNERDRFAFYLVLTYVLNIVDAYVGASLYSFEVTEDLGEGTGLRAEWRMRLP